MSHDREARKKGKADLEHMLKQKWRRYIHLRDEARKLGKVTLDEPIRHGWKRKFVLNEQTKNRTDANIIQQLLDKVNHEYWSRERDWSDIHKHWLGLADIDNCQLNPLTNKEYNKLSEREKKFFKYEQITYNYYGRKGETKHYWIIEKPNMYFRMKDRKYWLTEVPVFDPELDSEVNGIWDWIETHGLYGKLANKMGWRQNFNDPYDARKRTLKAKLSKAEIRTYFEDKLNEEHESKLMAKRFEFDD